MSINSYLPRNSILSLRGGLVVDWCPSRPNSTCRLKLQMTQFISNSFYPVFISAHKRVWNIVVSMSVCPFICLSVCPLAYLRNHTTELHQIVVHLACSALEALRNALYKSSTYLLIYSVLWRLCDTLCISGFVDAVIFHTMNCMVRCVYYLFM